MDRNIKSLLFEEKEAKIFENYLLDTLEKIESIFINEINEENEEEEEDEKEKKEENNIIKDKEKENKEKNNKKIFLRNVYGIGERKESLDAKSSSRFLYKNMYI